MASSPVTPLTEEQYLELDRAAEVRSEFHDGQMFAMAGGSPNHAFIATKISALLTAQNLGGCRVFNSDLRMKVSKAGLYTYADGGIVCGEPQLTGKDTLLNPKLIVEVLSPSTEAYDRGKKFESYRTIESFTEYLLVHQDRRHVEHYSRQPDGSWLLRESSGIEGSVNITSLSIRLPLAEIYSTALDLD
jgi:Uma2 family endonuclease